MRAIVLAMMMWSVAAGAQELNLAVAAARSALARGEFAQAKRMFAEYLRLHPADVQAGIGLGDAEAGLHEFGAAEVTYRKVTAAAPLAWAAHRALVLVEAKLGRWEDFDRERALLREARERGAADRRESDVIDSFDVMGRHWIVREYFEPMGRGRARINFESFSRAGRVVAYVSLENAQALRSLTAGDAVVVGGPAVVDGDEALALDFYDGTRHGVVATFEGEPRYEDLRRVFLGWVRGGKQAHLLKN